jgi:hypothetical protein
MCNDVAVVLSHGKQIAAADDSIATAEAEARRLKADVKVSNHTMHSTAALHATLTALY